MPSQAPRALPTTVLSFRILQAHAEALNSLPATINRSMLVRAVLSMYFDGAELPSEIRAQRVKFLAQKVMRTLKKTA